MTDSPELLFLRSYRDAVMEFNRLDRNLAYFLRNSAERGGAEVKLEEIFRHAFDDKLKKATALLRKGGWSESHEEFVNLAGECRLARNRLVHGEWWFAERLDKPIRFKVYAPGEESGSYDQGSFNKLVSTYTRANKLFHKLQEIPQPCADT